MPCRVLMINVTALVTLPFLVSTVTCTAGICSVTTGNPVVCVAGRITRLSCFCNSRHICNIRVHPISQCVCFITGYIIFDQMKCSPSATLPCVTGTCNGGNYKDVCNSISSCMGVLQESSSFYQCSENVVYEKSVGGSTSPIVGQKFDGKLHIFRDKM